LGEAGAPEKHATRAVPREQSKLEIQFLTKESPYYIKATKSNACGQIYQSSINLKIPRIC
jgi:hypothetical protein